MYISPENKSFLGSGLFADVFKDATKMIRDYITANPEEWNEIITEYKEKTKCYFS